MSTGAFDLGSYGAEIVLNTSQFEQGMQNAETQMTNTENTTKGWASNVGTIAAGAVAGLGVALAGVGIAGFKMADDLDKSLNGLQASTGATQEEMEGMEESLKNIYNNGYGESFQEIADTMAIAKNTTGAWGEDLQWLSQDALMLRDTFGFEVNESLRSSDKLMKQFGLTGTDAMALIAEGSQRGLNFADDLLPTIDEYSVYFKQAGMDASDMFGMFENAKNAGVFNLDYAADAFKEFGIIMLEDSTRASDALSRIGVTNGESLQKQFASGGEGAKEAFRSIAEAVGSVEDPLLQSQVLVELFGTKAEDMGVDAVLAMSQVNDSITGNVDVLNEINEIKYDSFGEALQGIGRNLNTELIVPIGEKVLPKMNEFADWITDHMPQIKDGIKDALDTASKAYDGLKDAVKFVTDNMNILLPVIAGVTGVIGAQMIINTLTGFYNAWRVATTSQTTAQWLLNAAMNANPIGLVALAIGALIGVGVLLYKNWDTIKEKASDLWLILQDKFAKIKSAITKPIQDAKDTVMGLVDKIKDAFDFKWKLPDLKLPHVSVDMKENKWGIPYPDFDVKWYANGGFFDKPELAVLGDAGQEAAVPLVGKRMDPFADAVYRRIEQKTRANATQNQSSTIDNSKHYNLSNVTIKAENPMELFQGIDNIIRSQ